VIITEQEFVTRARHGMITICPLCYDAKKVINMILYEQRGSVGVIKNYCPSCLEALNLCHSCPKVPKGS